MKPTPLHILVLMLGGPDTDEASQLMAWAQSVDLDSQRSEREREVARYMADASTGRLTPQGRGRGSLKHLLWWLRDHAGSLYEPAARAVLRAVIDTDLSLGTIASSLSDHPLIGGLVQQSLQSERADDLTRHLIWEDTPRGRVAWNYTTLNLAKIAFRSGATYYAALSAEGGCLMAARGVVIAGLPIGEGWTQPYPNLVVLTRPAALADEAHLRRYLLRCSSS